MDKELPESLSNSDEYNVLNERINILEQKLTEIKDIVSELSIENKNKLDKIIELENEAIANAREAVWAEVFHDTINNSDWLLDKSLSPGRAAVGYQFLYVMYRVLDNIQPKSILEMGLGETTKVITQYVKSVIDCKHYVVEHDESWIKNFNSRFDLSERTLIWMTDLGKMTWGNDNEIVSYKGFKDEFVNKKFDFICIDGPFGYNAKIFARADILPLLPNILENTFVIMIDDYDRVGEQNLAIEIIKILKNNSIAHRCGKYYGNKGMIIISSQNISFSCTV